MQYVYYTLAGIGLYFLSDWILRRIETCRGEVLEQRTLVFFVIISVLAVASFQGIEWLTGR